MHLVRVVSCFCCEGWRMRRILGCNCCVPLSGSTAVGLIRSGPALFNQFLFWYKLLRNNQCQELPRSHSRRVPGGSTPLFHKLDTLHEAEEFVPFISYAAAGRTCTISIREEKVIAVRGEELIKVILIRLF